MLSVRRGKEESQIYKAAFSATELSRIENRVREVVVRQVVGDAEFWIADESHAHRNFSPESLGGATARMILVVDDPDAVFAQELRAGALAIHPVQESHGWRQGRVMDPYGHH